jgi:hypothetical protein
MGDIEYGRCDVCRLADNLIRTYYYFPIKCECCGPVHHEYVRHCINCTPEMPAETNVHLKTKKLLDPIHEGLFKKVKR